MTVPKCIKLSATSVLINMTLAKIIQMPSVLVGAYTRASKNEIDQRSMYISNIPI